ncbi:hypothetical protein M0Q97_12755 [Candidatus Dojkabacteria bacterium]|jgi:hypothetical protein|nr:hypothetical protein [Candidatus Dojkabacteria bacterium]
MAANLFAKKTAKAPAKKNDKLNVNVSGKEFAEKLDKFATLKAQIENLESELAMSQEFVKATSIAEFAKLVETKKNNPGSFTLTSDNGGTVMFLPTKRYIKIDEAAAENLKETYGESVVEETTKYSFNTDVLMRNMDVISELIQNSTEISEDDKENLIEGITTFTIEKDTLDKVYVLANESKNSVSEVLEDIQPVYQLKTPKAGKSE